MGASSRTLTLLAASSVLAGCLPLGPAPAGKQLLTDGTAYDIQFVPGPTGSPSQLITYRITNDDGQGGPYSIYALQQQTGSALDGETFLTNYVSTRNIFCASANCPLPTDSLGRAFVQRQQALTMTDIGTVPFDESLTRVDPASAQTVDFGPNSSLVGIFAQRAGTAYSIVDSLRVRDVADDETRFDTIRSPVVLGDALYFLTPDEARGQGTVRRLTAPPFDVPEPVTDGVTLFSVYHSDPPLLGLCRLQGDATACTSSVFDPVTGQEQPLPEDAGNFQSISPSGRYVQMVRYPVPLTDPTTPPDPNAPSDIDDFQTTLTLFDRQLGAQQSVAVTALQTTVWRPGHDELWFVTAASNPDPNLPPSGPQGQQTSIWRWVPGADPIEILPQQNIYLLIPTDNPSWPFTPDGRFLITTAGSANSQPPVFVRDADSPAATLLALNPTGTGVADIRVLPDGRLVVADWITDVSHADLYLADVAAGTLQPIGHGGKIVAVGATRVLALLDWLATGGSGSLSLIDLVTGTTTQLAQAVHAVAIDGPATPGGDLLAPGTRVAWLSHNRVSSPYDGLWLTSLP